jgi:hypothetical protein
MMARMTFVDGMGLVISMKSRDKKAMKKISRRILLTKANSLILLLRAGGKRHWSEWKESLSPRGQA